LLTPNTMTSLDGDTSKATNQTEFSWSSLSLDDDAGEETKQVTLKEDVKNKLNEFGLSQEQLLLFEKIQSVIGDYLPLDILTEVIGFIAKMVVRVVGPREGLSFRVNKPGAMCVDTAKNIWVVEEGGASVRVINLSSGTSMVVAGNGLHNTIDGEGENASFDHPKGIVYHPKLDFIFVSERGGIRGLDPATTEVVTYAAPGTAQSIGLLTIDPATGDIMAVSDTYARVYRVLNNGTYKQYYPKPPRSYGALNKITGLVFDHQNFLYLTDGCTLIVFSPAGDEIELLTGLNDACGLSICQNTGTLYICESGKHRVMQLPPNSRSVTRLAGTTKSGLVNGNALTEAQFNKPVFSLPYDDYVVVSDNENYRLRKIVRE